MNFEQLTAEIAQSDDATLRNTIYSVAADSPDPGQLYSHQIKALSLIEQGSNKHPPISGILHYPTGAGKTRVALEFIARTLRNDPQHRFIWATAHRNLVRQSMLRMAELSRLFPVGTSFTWCKNADEIENIEQDVDVVFLTRSILTKVLDHAGDGRRSKHPWRVQLERRQPMTLVYDECHQLGANTLQRSWGKFDDSVVLPNDAPWRTIGLSATPVPTRQAAHELLSQVIFPLRQDSPPTGYDNWPFHVYHHVDNDILIQSGVLCPIDLYLDQKGYFDIPTALLEQVIGDSHMRPPGPDAQPAELQRYALGFNKHVLSDPRVISFLVDRIGRSIEMLGKTIVFAPNIAAANLFAAELYDRFPNLRGDVAAVHSQIEQLCPPYQPKATVHEVINRFRDKGRRPSVLVNVDMLTEGFDDPKIQTVVLARLTLSTNRFWQMIGRGTRGPAAHGTTSCTVIDPVKLVRVYDYFGGYQPGFAKGGPVLVGEEEDDQEAASDGCPEISAFSLPPDPWRVAYQVDPELEQELERLRAQVALALRHFIDGASISESAALEIARSAAVNVSDGQPVFAATQDGFQSDTAAALVLGELSALEHRADKDLTWFRRLLPASLNEELLKQRLRALRAIEALSLWTESAFASAQMNGEFLQAMGLEAQAVAGPTPSAPEPSAALQFEPAEAAVVDTALAMSATGRALVPAEVAVLVETLRRMFGRAPSDELGTTLATRRAGALPLHQLEINLNPGQRQLLFLKMAELAAADGIVTDEERQALGALANSMSISEDTVDFVLGGHLAQSGLWHSQPETVSGPISIIVRRASEPEPEPHCPSCSFPTPSGALVCPFCGTVLSDTVAANGGAAS